MALSQRYEYLEELGRGGHARVLACIDRQAGDRQVALKTVAAEHAASLSWELERLQTLRAPQLAEAYGLLSLREAEPAPFSLHAGAHLLVQARAPGLPALRALRPLRSEPRSVLAFVYRATRDALLALRELHAAGFVHRDVTPANLVAEPDGRSVLVDLELTVPAGSACGVAGTPAYIAPEAFARAVTPSLDVFALGATAFDLLLGEAPALRSQRGEAAVPWRQRRVAELPPWVPLPVGELLAGWLHPEPERRPGSALEALAELDSHAEAFGLPEVSALSFGAGAAAPVDVAGRALTRPYAGSRDAVDSLIVAMDRGGVVQVLGPTGAGKSRLVREAVRGLQLERARREQPILDYLPLDSLGRGFVPREPAWLHVEHADAADARVALAVCRGAEAVERHAVVVLEAPDPLPGVEATVRVAPLSEAAAAELLREIWGRPLPERTLRAALVASEGFAGRLCRMVADGIRSGRRMGDAVAWEAAADEAGLQGLALTAEQRHWLNALALWDGPVRGDTLGDAPLSPAARGRLAQALVERGLLHARGESAWLAASTARALRARLTESDKARARELLTLAFGAARLDATPWLASGEARVVALLARVASKRAEGAVETALAVLDESAEVGEDPRLDLARADALRAQGRYLEALRCVQGYAQPELRFAQGELLRLTGDVDGARELLEGLAPAADAFARRAAAVLARMCLDTGDMAGARRWIEEGEACAEDAEGTLRLLESKLRAASDQELDTVADALWAVSVSHGSPRFQARAASLRASRRPRGDNQAASEWRFAQQLAEQAGEAHEAASYALNLGLSRLDAGDLGGALQMLQEGARGFAALSRPLELGRVLFNLANAWLLIGESALADRVLVRAERESRHVGDTLALSMCAVLRAESLVRKGVPGEARRTLEQALQGACGETRALLAARLAFVLASLDRELEAADVLGPYLEDAGAYEGEVTLARVRVALARGSLQDAEQIIAGLSRALAVEGSFEDRVRALLLGAEVARAAGHGERVASRFAECRQLLDRAMRGLTPAQQARMRSVERYARAFEAQPVARRGELVDANRWRRMATAVARLFRQPDVQRVAECLCEVALELVPAERALWIVRGEAGGERVAARAPEPLDDSAERDTHSGSIVSQAWLSGETVTAVDALADARWDSAHSVRSLSLRSVAAVPMRTPTSLAVLLLEDRLRPAAFEQDDVLCLQELVRAAEAALAVADQRVRERELRLQAEQRERQLGRQVQAGSLPPGGHPIVGSSRVLAACLQLADRVARSDLPALVRGESGTGKELIARRIHHGSERGGAAFVAENCAALPETLLESVLFGHVRGAFTGASRDHEGLFAQADGGTLFLDEIGEMSAGMQAKLLRVLETGEVRPVGGQRAVQAQVRLVAATHRDLARDVREGRFREDLFYRVAVVEILVPPLRERVEDIPELVAHFLAMHAAGRRLSVSADALAFWQGEPWPGNVRELENAVRRAIVLADGEIELSHARTPRAAARGPEPGGLDLHAQVEALQRRLVQQAMASAGSNQTQAAELLGVSRYGLQKMLKRFAQE